MHTCENGGHAYHATLRTDALQKFRDTVLETRDYGFDRIKQHGWGWPRHLDGARLEA